MVYNHSTIIANTDITTTLAGCRTYTVFYRHELHHTSSLLLSFGFSASDLVVPAVEVAAAPPLSMAHSTEENHP